MVGAAIGQGLNLNSELGYHSYGAVAKYGVLGMTLHNLVTTCRHEAIVRILGPNFCVGAILRDHVVVKAAPLIKYMIGWPEARLIAHCEDKGWRYEIDWQHNFDIQAG